VRNPLKLAIPAVAASLLIAACGGTSSYTSASPATTSQPAVPASNSSAVAITTAANAKLGTILVDGEGMTLYHLSGEKAGKFICTSSACLGIWHPVTVTPGETPAGGVASLGTVKRPDGTTQVTYQGAPLYTFTQDRQPGEANGEGIKDVGTWSAVTTGSSGSGSPAPSSEAGYKY
jgi:predicted lipoprotein with Yx(FWY)xxD motif